MNMLTSTHRRAVMLLNAVCTVNRGEEVKLRGEQEKRNTAFSQNGRRLGSQAPTGSHTHPSFSRLSEERHLIQV